MRIRDSIVIDVMHVESKRSKNHDICTEDIQV